MLYWTFLNRFNVLLSYWKDVLTWLIVYKKNTNNSLFIYFHFNPVSQMMKGMLYWNSIGTFLGFPVIETDLLLLYRLQLFISEDFYNHCLHMHAYFVAFFKILYWTYLIRLIFIAVILTKHLFMWFIVYKGTNNFMELIQELTS